MSWRDGEERLFVSSASLFEAGAAIRGGIPICFPQFAARGAVTFPPVLDIRNLCWP